MSLEGHFVKEPTTGLLMIDVYTDYVAGTPFKDLGTKCHYTMSAVDSQVLHSWHKQQQE